MLAVLQCESGLGEGKAGGLATIKAACFKVAEETGWARQEALYLSLPLRCRRVAGLCEERKRDLALLRSPLKPVTAPARAHFSNTNRLLATT